MKLITKNTDYAVKALCHIVEDKEKIFSVAELAPKLKIPRPFLRRILQVLNKEGILRSFKGKSGGFQLAIEPEKIFLLDLMKIFQGKIDLSNCISKKKICPDVKVCVLRKKVGEIEKYIVKELEAVTIENLLSEGR